MSKINFKKNKKYIYYFDTFLNEKYFEKQLLLQSRHTIPKPKNIYEKQGSIKDTARVGRKISVYSLIAVLVFFLFSLP